MAPAGGGEPTGPLARQSRPTWAGSTAFKEAFNKAAATRFGSRLGVAGRGKDGKLAVTSTPNQDSPLMDGAARRSSAWTCGNTPTTSSTRTSGPTTSRPSGT